MLVLTSTSAQYNWSLERDKNGIKVYTAHSTTSGLKMIRSTATFEGSFEKVIAVFSDVPNQTAWVYGTKQAYLIKRFSDQEFLYYVETALPWPASNRDIAIRMKIKEDNNVLTISTIGEPHAIAVTKNIVRVPHLTGTWTFKKAGEGQVSIDYFLDVDPGGSLPNWLVNMFVDKGPYETLYHLSQQLKK